MTNSVKKNLVTDKHEDAIGYKVGNVYHINRIAKMADIRAFSAELVEEFEEWQIFNIDDENRWWRDDIEAEFYQEKADAAGLEGWEVDYLFWHLGY
jgi:hypothetical protein